MSTEDEDLPTRIIPASARKIESAPDRTEMIIPPPSAPVAAERTQGIEKTQPPAPAERTAMMAPPSAAYERTAMMPAATGRAQAPAPPERTAMMAPPSADSDRTEIAPRASSYDQRTEFAAPPAAPAPRPITGNEGGNMLPVGTYLAEFEITKVLGEGGFGIVYLAHDHSLGRRVALKEYMPSSLAQRIGGTHVSVKSERHRETFEAGLKSFVNEARLLAQFDHPSLVKVYRFWEAHGTAYMIMPFYEGITLKDQLKAMGAPPDEAWLRELLEPLTEALAVIHDEQCYHRDIAPDNVILLKGSNLPLLLDFGAARRVIGDMTQALTVILKPGYAPVEQYAEVPGMKQGPWTDVYALAAVVYYAINGKTPPTSVARLMNDAYVPLAQIGAGRYSPTFLAAIDRALAVKPEQRTQTVEALRQQLGMSAPDITLEDSARTRARGRSSAAAPLSAAVTLPPAAAVSRRSRTAVFAAIGGVAVLAIAGALYALMGSHPAGDAAGKTAAGAAVPPIASSSPVVVAASPTVATPVAPPPVAAPAGPMDPVLEFERVIAMQSPGHEVFAAADKPTLRIGKDEISFKVKTNQEGYLYVFQFGSDNEIVQIFPSKVASGNLARADSTTSIPGEKACKSRNESSASCVQIPAGGPPGVDRLLAIVSKHARDFSALGLKEQGGFKQSSLAAVRAAGEQWNGKGSIFAGKAICDAPCTDDYGAAVFNVEEVK